MNVIFFCLVCSLSCVLSRGRYTSNFSPSHSLVLQPFRHKGLATFRGGTSTNNLITSKKGSSSTEKLVEKPSLEPYSSSSIGKENQYTSSFNWSSVENYYHHPSTSESTCIVCSYNDVDCSSIAITPIDSIVAIIGDSVHDIASEAVVHIPVSLSSESPSTTADPCVNVIVDMHPNEGQLTLPVSSLSIASFTETSAKSDNKVMLRATSTTKVIRLVWYYFLLYFFTVVYNVANKKVLEFLPLPATVSALQTLIGIPLFLPLWMLKPPRHLDTIDRSSLMKIALCHGLGNLATVYALQSGTVSFTHVIKSAEPLFTAILSIIFMKSTLSTSVYLSLLPIVFGVGLASAKELSFSWFGFFAAMLSNFFYQLRMVWSKVSFAGNEENKLSAANTFRVITIFSFIQLIPIALVLEGNQIFPAFVSMLSHPEGLKFTLVNLLIAGASFYFYNEVGFWILDLVHPVTHAVGNTIKRVVLVLASIIIFRNPVNNIGLIGAGIAILGSFLYALASQQKK